MLTALAENVKLIGGCIAGVSAICGGYIALDGPLPASKSWVLAENAAVKSRIIDTQLQTTSVQRQLLRKEKFDRELDMQKTTDPNMRSVLQNRLYEVEDNLREIDEQADQLRKEKRGL